MKHKFKKMKEDFVKNISIFNLMVLVSTYDNCTDCGVHFTKPSFDYLHTIFYTIIYSYFSSMLSTLIVFSTQFYLDQKNARQALSIGYF